MTKFGTLKTKILHCLTEAYTAGNKKEVKEILQSIKENKEFKELYLFYEEVENMYLDDKELAKLYVENVEKLLMEKTKRVSKYSKSLDKKLKSENLVEVDLYKNLDLLAEEDTLKTVDKKMLGKKKLVEHLTTKKELTESTSEFTNNEGLLLVVLSSEFNGKFGDSLSEGEKEELQKLLTIPNDQLVNEFNTLKEQVDEKMNCMLTEEQDEVVKGKLKESLTEAKALPPTKYNYYKLQQLKNGL